MRRYLKKILLCFLIINGFLFFSSINQVETQEPAADLGVSTPGLVSLDFEATDIKDVMRVLSQKSGINIVLGQDVEAVITIQLKDVSWRQALDIILKNYNLTYKEEENLIRVMTLEQLKIEEEKIPLVSIIVILDFADVEDVKGSLDTMLSSRGSIETNNRTNALIITDIPDKVKLIKEVAEDLDLRTPQVMIEAMMVDIKLTDQESMGLDLTFRPNKLETERSFTQALQLAGTASGSIIFNKTLFEKLDLQALIELWQENKTVNILANPRIMTLDNLTATIELIEEIPYTQVTESTEGGSLQSTQFKEAGIKLYVTPHITQKGNYISMNIKVEQSFRSGWTSDGEPIIDSRNAETNLMVKDDETIVIGGLRKKEDTVTVDKNPILGDMPLIGALFRRTVKDFTNIDLLIFVTPKIITKPALSKKERVRFDEFSEKREYEVEDLEITGPEFSPAIKEEPFSLRPPD